MKQKVLFLGCNHDEIPYLENFKEKGFYIVTTDMNPNAPGIPLADVSYECGYNDFEGLDRVIDQEGPEEFCLAFTASAQFAHLGVSYVSKRLGKSYPCMEDIQVCLDKTRFYPLFEKNGISIPDTYYIRNKDELERALDKYSNDSDFYLKSDFSKNPNHIYTGTPENLLSQEIQWTPDRYFREYYVLQQAYIGEGIRLNLYPSGYEIFEFETGNTIDTKNWLQFEDYGIIKRLREMVLILGMQGWLLKFDVLIGKDGYVVLDIGMDPPYRMKKYWESKKSDFVDFYVDLYLKAGRVEYK